MNKTIAVKVLDIAIELIKKILFVLIFMKVPQMLFVKFMDVQDAGFGLENCFVYFGLVLCGICGSLIRSEIFSDEHTDVNKIENAKLFFFVILERFKNAIESPNVTSENL